MQWWTTAAFNQAHYFATVDASSRFVTCNTATWKQFSCCAFFVAFSASSRWVTRRAPSYLIYSASSFFSHFRINRRIFYRMPWITCNCWRKTAKLERMPAPRTWLLCSLASIQPLSPASVCMRACKNRLALWVTFFLFREHSNWNDNLKNIT